MEGTYLVHVDMVGPGQDGTFLLNAIVNAVAEIITECLHCQEFDMLGGNENCDLLELYACDVGGEAGGDDFRAYGPFDTPLWILKLSWITPVDIINRETHK